MIGTLIAKKALASAFDAMNRHDLAAFMSAWHEDAVFIYPGDIPQSGTFRGKTEVENWFRGFFKQYPAINFQIQSVCVANIFGFLGNNRAAVHWNVRLTNQEGRKGENSGVTVLDIRGGKVVSVKDFIFDLGENFRLNWSAA